MKATGEVMALDRSFESGLMKALRSLEIGVLGLGYRHAAAWSEEHLDHLIVALFVLLHFQRHGDYKSKVPPGLKKKMEGKSALKVCTCVCESTCV
jgi:hypothetical protein